MKFKKSKRRTINILKLVIGLTIFRRWRTVYGAEEQPSPSGFAMVFQKAPTSPRNNSTDAATTKKTLIDHTNRSTNHRSKTCSTKQMVILIFNWIN